jgi:hypothetical protein
MDMVKEQALLLARKGKPLKDYKLVRGRVQGYCTDEIAFVNQAVDDAITSGAIHPDEVDTFKSSLYNTPKIKGMTANKKIVNKDLVNKYYRKPDAKLELVPITHKGSAIMPDATNKFEAV